MKEELRGLRRVLGMLLAKVGRDALRTHNGRRPSLDEYPIPDVKRGRWHLSDEDWEFALGLGQRIVAKLDE